MPTRRPDSPSGDHLRSGAPIPSDDAFHRTIVNNMGDGVTTSTTIERSRPGTTSEDGRRRSSSAPAPMTSYSYAVPFENLDARTQARSSAGEPGDDATVRRNGNGHRHEADAVLPREVATRLHVDSDKPLAGGADLRLQRLAVGA